MELIFLFIQSWVIGLLIGFWFGFSQIQFGLVCKIWFSYMFNIRLIFVLNINWVIDFKNIDYLYDFFKLFYLKNNNFGSFIY